MSSLLLRKIAKGASPEYRQQVPSIGKDFLKRKKGHFSSLGCQYPSSAVHLQQRETDSYGR